MIAAVLDRATIGTSSGSQLVRHPPIDVVLAAGRLFEVATTSGLGAVAGPFAVIALLSGQTTSGMVVAGAPVSSKAILEVRRLSGLTWDQLARIFAVDRRSLHFWASGKPLSPANEERLQRLLVTIRRIDRGAAAATRALLFTPLVDGAIPYDLLCAEQFDRLMVLVGGRLGTPTAPELSSRARAARKPRPPAEHLGAEQDRVHKDEGVLLSTTPIRTKRE
jgi:hypothetical protein